jgi:hypothetical protein
VLRLLLRRWEKEEEEEEEEEKAEEEAKEKEEEEEEEAEDDDTAISSSCIGWASKEQQTNKQTKNLPKKRRSRIDLGAGRRDAAQSALVAVHHALQQLPLLVQLLLVAKLLDVRERTFVAHWCDSNGKRAKDFDEACLRKVSVFKQLSALRRDTLVILFLSKGSLRSPLALETVPTLWVILILMIAKRRRS